MEPPNRAALDSADRDSPERRSNPDRRDGSDRRSSDHLSRVQLLQTVEHQRTMLAAEQVHMRGCHECRQELDNLVRAYENRLAEYQKYARWAPVTILFALIMGFVIFLAVIVKTW